MQKNVTTEHHSARYPPLLMDQRGILDDDDNVWGSLHHVGKTWKFHDASRGGLKGMLKKMLNTQASLCRF